MFPILTFIIFFPTLAAGLILLVDKTNKSLIRGITFIATLIVFLASMGLFFYFKNNGDPQFVEKYDWMPEFGIEYFVAVDGISLLLILLTTLTCLICCASTFKAIDKHLKEFMVLFLILETGMIGVFCALDFFLFYVFWELMLIPMYFIIGIWGGARKVYAAVKFFIYTMFGSLLMLVAIIWLYFHFFQINGYYSTNILAYHGLAIPLSAQIWLFLAFFLAFAIKVPLFPFHTWLPDAHVEAPTAGSVILAGVLLKMGTYGFLRFSIPILPLATFKMIAPIMILSVVGIIYGAWVATVQKDVKKLIAYSSVSHLGFVMIGMFALTVPAVGGGLLQMVNHGISTGGLFLAVGILYERRGSRLIEDFGGITKVMPLFTVIFMILTLSSIGLPGTNGFVGEFLILVGAWDQYPIVVILAASGVIWAAVYMLWMFQRVMFGKITNDKNLKLADLDYRELGYFAPLIVLVFFIGIYPKPLLEKIEPSVVKLIRQVELAKKESEVAKLLNDNKLTIDDSAIKNARQGH